MIKSFLPKRKMTIENRLKIKQAKATKAQKATDAFARDRQLREALGLDQSDVREANDLRVTFEHDGRTVVATSKTTGGGNWHTLLMYSDEDMPGTGI